MAKSAELDQVMDATYSALIAGDIAQLAGLAAATERLVTGLEKVNRTTAAGLKRKADRNAPLIEAAVRGVQSARRHLHEFSAEQALATYDARGHRAVFGQVTPEQPKRI